MTNEQIKRLLIQALNKSNTDGPSYDVVKLVVQVELIISMLEDEKSLTRNGSKYIEYIQ